MSESVTSPPKDDATGHFFSVSANRPKSANAFFSVTRGDEVSPSRVTIASRWIRIAGRATLTALDRYSSLRDRVILDNVRDLPGVDAVFLSNDDRGGLIVYVVAMEHSDALYAAVIDAEDELANLLSEERVEVRVRAHQGRAASEAVPTGSRALWTRR